MAGHLNTSSGRGQILAEEVVWEGGEVRDEGINGFIDMLTSFHITITDTLLVYHTSPKSFIHSKLQNQREIKLKNYIWIIYN